MRGGDNPARYTRVGIELPTGDPGQMGLHLAAAPRAGMPGWAKWVARLGIALYGFVLACLPWAIYDAYWRAGVERHVIAWVVGFAFLSLAVPLSVWDVMVHLLDFRNSLQAHVIRIQFMVPVYAIEVRAAGPVLSCPYAGLNILRSRGARCVTRRRRLC
jgi:hypothetical protein